jgi:hypothetical protein
MLNFALIGELIEFCVLYWSNIAYSARSDEWVLPEER